MSERKRITSYSAFAVMSCQACERVLLLCFLLCLTSCRFSDYSDGFRVGTITKFSNKGVIWKTWEGEMVLGGLRSDGGSAGGNMANIWQFSIDQWQRRNENIEKLVKDLTRAAESGQRVKIYYKQDFQILRGFSRGDTDYFVQRVEFVQ